MNAKLLSPLAVLNHTQKIVFIVITGARIALQTIHIEQNAKSRDFVEKRVMFCI